MKVCFDFDKTLTKRDTLIGFYKHCATSIATFYMKMIAYSLYVICYKVRLISNEQLKRNGLKLFLRGLDQEEYKGYSLSYGNSIETTDLFLSLNKHLEKGHKVYIVTASFTDYVKAVFRNLKLEVVGSEINFVEGKIHNIRRNCFGEEKVNQLKELGIKKLDVFYTDSFDDKPLMDISNKVYLVKFQENKNELIEIT